MKEKDTKRTKRRIDTQSDKGKRQKEGMNEIKVVRKKRRREMK